MLLLSITLSIPWVQTKLADYATKTLNESFNTNIAIEKLDLSFLGNVSLIGVKIRDHHNDTLIYVDKLATAILNPRGILNSNIKLGSISIENAHFYMKTYKGETDNSLSIFLDKFESEPSVDSSATFYLSTANIYLDNFNYRIEDQNSEDSVQFAAYNTGGNIQDFFINDLITSAKLRGLYFTDNRGLSVTNFSTDFGIKDTSMDFGKFHLETLQTKIDANIRFDYGKDDLGDFNDKVYITANFKKSTLAVADLRKYYADINGNDTLSFRGKMRGELNDFRLNNLSVTSKKGIKIIGDLNFKNSVASERGFVFEGDLERVDANYNDLKNILPDVLGAALPSEMKRFGNFSLKGITKITATDITATLNLSSRVGDINSDLRLTNIDNIDDATYDGEIELLNFDLGKFFRDPIFGEVSFQGEVKGSGFKFDNINTSIIGEFSRFEFKNYIYQNINVNGRYQNNLFEGELAVDDENLRLDFIGLADLSSKVHEFDFQADIAYANLKKTNLFERDSIAKVRGKIVLDIEGNTFNDILGKAVFTNVFYTNQNKEYEFKEFIVTSAIKENVKSIEIDSKDIVNGHLDGDFNFDDILPMAQNALGSIYNNYSPNTLLSNKFINFNFSIYNQIVEVFFPELEIDKNTYIKGKIDADNNKFKLTIASPKIKAFNVEVKDLLLRTDNQNELYNSHLTASEINSEVYNVQKFNLLSKTKNDTLFFKSIFKGTKDKSLKKKNEEYNVDFFYTINEEKQSVLGLEKSSLNFKENEWIVNPENNKENKVVFDFKNEYYLFSPFTLVSAEQKIEFKGLIEGEDKTLFAEFEKVKLKSLLPVVDSLEINGVLNGNIDFLEKEGKYTPEGILLVNSFKINEFEQGDLALIVKGDNSYQNYDVNLSLQNEDIKSLSATGAIDFSTEIPQIDLSIFMEDFELASFSPLGGDVISKLRGKASGDFTVKGRLGEPDMNGNLSLENAGLMFPYLNVDYDFTGISTIALDEQSFIFEDINLEDVKYKTKGKFTGSITHQNFKSWFMDLNIAADKMLLLDTQDDEEALYYGTAFITGAANISGLTDKLTINVNAKTEKGTTFTIPLKDVQTISNFRLIHFKSENNNTQDNQEIAIDAVKGVSLSIDLQVTKDAVAEVVIDKVNGSKLKGSGSGDLRIDINTRGKFEMYGDYTIDNGVYDFKYGGVINKPFVIQQGGTVSWEGDPMDANLNVNAIYEAKANPAVILENFNTNRKIPINLEISISGGLFNSNQEFDIKIPNVNSNIASELEFVLNENDANNNAKQFFSLLAFGNFSNPDNSADFNSNDVLTGTTSSILANVLTDLISSEDGKFQLGVDYTQGNQNEIDNLNTDTQVDVSVSTQVSNRVIINGKVGVPVGVAAQSSIVGEVKIEVLLTQEGNLRFLVFNRQNEIQYSTEEEGYTQGVGLSYQVNFNSLSDLLKRVGRNKNSEVVKEEKLPKETTSETKKTNQEKNNSN